MMELYIYCLLFYFVKGDEVTVDSKTDGDITVTCSNNYYLPNCQWQHKSSLNQFKDLAGSNKYQNPATLRMTIKSFTFADRGSYRCKCYDKRRDYKYSSSMTIDTADVNTVHSLNCDHTGSHYKWERKKRTSYRRIDINSKYSNTTSKVLTLLNVDLNDDGIYRCGYHDSYRWQHGDLYLIVQEYPKIRIDNTQTKAAIGTSVYMRCTIRKTRPSVTEVWWVKGNSRIQADERKYEVRNGTTYTSLNVFNVNTNDAGEYKCYARNAREEMFANTTLVTGNNPQSPIAAKDMYTVKEGTSVVLRCDPQTSIPPITELWWQIHTFGHIRNLTNSLKNFDGTLTAPDLHIKDFRSPEVAEYTCNVANAFGTSQVGMEVQLGKPPNVRAVAAVYIPIRGRTLTITCNINNGTRMWWKRFNGRNEINVDINKPSGQKTSSLSIRNIQTADDGNYRCYGENEFGSTYVTIRISSRYIPLVSLPTEIKEVNKGSDTLLDCSYDSYPNPTKVFWKKDDNIIKSSKTFRKTYNGSSVEISVYSYT